MEFFARVPSSNSRTREAEQVNETFKSNLDVLKSLLQYGESSDVSSLMDVVYEKSSPEERIFMKTPTQARLRSKEELVVRILIGLLSLGVPTMAEMLAFIKKHGVEGIASTLVSLLELLCPLLDGKETPKFTLDDVVDAIDSVWHFGSPAASPVMNVIASAISSPRLSAASGGDSPLHPIPAASLFQRIVSYARHSGWHSGSATASPLMNVIASATSSPRLIAASVGDSRLHPIATASPFRRILSDRSMFLSRLHEFEDKTVCDETAKSSAHPTLLTSISSQYPSSNKSLHSHSKELISDIPLPPVEEMPESNSLDRSMTQRKNSSLSQLLVEETVEGSEGRSSRCDSGSMSRWRTSSELPEASTSQVPELQLDVNDKAPVWEENLDGSTVDKLLTDKIDTHRRPISEDISILQEHEGLSVQSQRQMPEYSEVEGKADETRLHVIENKVREASASASLASQYDGEEDMEYAAEGKKHTKVDMKSNENKQDLKHPSAMERVLQEATRKTVWEAPGVVNGSVTQPLHQTDKADRESRKLEICNSMVQHAAPVDHLEPNLGDRRFEWLDMEPHAAQSRKKRGYAGKLVNNCLACCRKPRTIS